MKMEAFPCPWRYIEGKEKVAAAGSKNQNAVDMQKKLEEMKYG
jgi:hypothetical protein